jgi:hypothetical protein
VQVDLVDNVLPGDAVADFALIDVEGSELECLEGMKETILRSPNLVIMCEWWNQSHNSPDAGAKIDTLLDWFTANRYKFHRIWHSGTATCDKEQFHELSKK